MLCNCNSQILYIFQASDVTVFQAKHNIDSGKTRLYLDPTTLEKNGYFAQQMAFLTNSDASLTERLKFPRSSTKNCEIEQA